MYGLYNSALCTPSNGRTINPLNAKLNPTCHLLALLGAHRILHVSRIRVNDYRIGQDMEGIGCGQFCNVIAGTQENDGEPELACRSSRW